MQVWYVSKNVDNEEDSIVLFDPIKRIAWCGWTYTEPFLPNWEECTMVWLLAANYYYIGEF